MKCSWNNWKTLPYSEMHKVTVRSGEVILDDHAVGYYYNYRYRCGVAFYLCNLLIV